MNPIRLVKACRPNLLIKALSGAAVVWAFLPEDVSFASHIHQVFQHETWSEGEWPHRLILCVGFVLWLPVVFLFAARETWQCGVRVRRDTGVGIARQISQQLWLSLRYAISPPWYYVFELHDSERRKRALEYLYRFETKAALYDMLRHYLSSPATTEALSNKATFARHCAQHGVPVIAALATSKGETLTRLDGGSEGLPHRDLFFKPIRGAGGRGAERWLYREDGSYVGHDGQTLDEERLLERLRKLGREEAYVIRAFARNHHEVAQLSPGALSTIRVVTCRNEEGCAEVTHAVLRMARDASVVVDNFHAGGLASPIDLASGVLGPASDMGLRADSRWHDTHPFTGARITGRRLPMWDDVLGLACRAHNAFSDQCAIGWDIAILEDGPFLVEGNKSPDLDIIQRIYREPIGNSRFGELFVYHVERALRVKRGQAVASAAPSATVV